MDRAALLIWGDGHDDTGHAQTERIPTMLERHLFDEQVIRSVVPSSPGVFMLINVHGDITLVGRSDRNLADCLSEYLREFEEHELIAEAEPEEFVFLSFATPWEAYLQECEWRWLNPMLTNGRAPANDSPVR